MRTPLRHSAVQAEACFLTQGTADLCAWLLQCGSEAHPSRLLEV